jgi:hypothetical protein
MRAQDFEPGGAVQLLLKRVPCARPKGRELRPRFRDVKGKGTKKQSWHKVQLLLASLKLLSTNWLTLP